MTNWTLKAALIERHGSQWRGAQAAGLGESTLSRIVTGKRSASAAEREALALVAGLPVDQLFTLGCQHAEPN